MKVTHSIVSEPDRAQTAVYAAVVLSLLVFPAFGVTDQKGKSEVKVNTSIEIPLDSVNFLSFLNKLHPGNRIGYRLHEQTPLQAGPIPLDAGTAGLDPDSQNALEENFRARPGVFVHERPVTEDGWVPQDWTFYVVPLDDGFELLWVVDTRKAGLNEFYSSQQCFRMSGKTNEEWRRKIAETPAFSEYDLWTSLEQEGQGKKGLSWVRRNGDWESVPATRKRLVSRTPLGVSLETALAEKPERILKTLDQNHEGEFKEDVESGLITRTNLEGTWVCGLYWERTTHVSCHHPADCLHSSVNLGPLHPHGKRAIRGRIYWMEGTKADLLDLWKQEFPKDR